MSCCMLAIPPSLGPTRTTVEWKLKPTPAVEDSNTQTFKKTVASQMPRKLAVGHIWQYAKSIYGCSVVKTMLLFIANLPSKQPWLCMDCHWHVGRLSSRSNCTHTSRGKSIEGIKHGPLTYHPMFRRWKKHGYELQNWKKKYVGDFFFAKDLLQFMDWFLGIQPPSKPKNSHSSWDPNDPSTSAKTNPAMPRYKSPVVEVHGGSCWLKINGKNL